MLEDVEPMMESIEQSYGGHSEVNESFDEAVEEMNMGAITAHAQRAKEEVEKYRFMHNAMLRNYVSVSKARQNALL